MTRSLVLIPKHGDRQFLTKEQAEELLASVPDYVEPAAEKPVVVEPVEFAGGNPDDAGKAVVSDKPLVFSPAGSLVFDNLLSDIQFRTQWRHIVSYNRAGRVMACLPDYFAAGLANDKDLIIKLRRDFNQGVVCGDRFFYRFNSCDARIVRPYGSTIVKPETVDIRIPFKTYASLKSLFVAPDGSAFVRSLFRINPELDNRNIADVFSNLTGMSSDDVYLDIPGSINKHRPSNKIRVPFLFLNPGSFLIHCGCFLSDDSISHSMHYIENR